MANTYKTILLHVEEPDIYERNAGGTITPGHLVKINSSDEFVVHSTSGGSVAPVLFAIEDALQGKTIADTYTSGNRVRAHLAEPGDEINVLIATSQNIAIGDHLCSAGDGTLAEIASVSTSAGNDFPHRLIATALEAVITTSAVARCRVVVV
jgi:hypothetical protein